MVLHGLEQQAGGDSKRTQKLVTTAAVRDLSELFEKDIRLKNRPEALAQELKC